MSETKLVGNGWTWFTDYAYAYSEWTLNAEPARQCEVGLGLKAFGKPLGQRKRFSGHVKVTSLGIGAVHARVVDGKGSCLVRLDQGDAGAISISREIP